MSLLKNSSQNRNKALPLIILGIGLLLIAAAAYAAAAPVGAAMPATGPQIGATFLARTQPSRLPWVLVATLGVAVLSLVAYIVMR